MRQSKRAQDVHENALIQFDKINDAYHEEREQSLQDRRFYSISGAQWEGNLSEQFENKPKFEVNKVHLSVIKIINEYRNNRITVDFVSKDGNPDAKLADVCDMLFRADEQDSNAEEAFDNGFEEAVGGGIGAWRLTTEYENPGDPDDDRQRIRIEPIYDADSCVFFDLDAKRQDKSDAKHCFVMWAMTPEAYELEWDRSPESMDRDINDTEYDWFAPDLVYVAEYYCVEKMKQTIYVYETLTGGEERFTEDEFEEDPELERKLQAQGLKKVREKRIETPRVHKYIMDGNEILEDCGYIAGKSIPIVPVYGKRWFIDGVERVMGHVRLVKDVQRLKNMLTSQLAEISSLSTVEKPIFTADQMAGHAAMWAEDNIKNYPYLLIEPFEDANGQLIPQGPVGYTKPPAIPPALAALMQLVDIDQKELLGGSGETDKMLSHVSGKAHELIQKRIDGQAYIYLSNFAKAIKRTGEIWLGMAKDIYVEPGRKMKAIDPLGQLSQVELGAPEVGPNEAVQESNNLTEASFDVTVDVGPTASSQKEATVQTILGMMQVVQDPETQQVLQSMALLNMEGDGIAQTRGYFRRKLVQMGVLEPTKEEAQMMAKAAQEAAQEPDPQKEALMAMAAEAQAKAQKAMAEVQEVLSDVQLNVAKTAETYSEVDMNNFRRVKEFIEAEQRQLEFEQRQMQEAMQRRAAMVQQPQQPGALPPR